MAAHDIVTRNIVFDFILSRLVLFPLAIYMIKVVPRDTPQKMSNIYDQNTGVVTKFVEKIPEKKTLKIESCFESA